MLIVASLLRTMSYVVTIVFLAFVNLVHDTEDFNWIGTVTGLEETELSTNL